MTYHQIATATAAIAAATESRQARNCACPRLRSERIRNRPSRTLSRSRTIVSPGFRCHGSKATPAVSSPRTSVAPT